MKEKTEKSLKDRWREICNSYVSEFCNRHGYMPELDFWVGDDPGTTACINDMFISMDDIRYDVDNDIPIDTFEKWYWKSLEIYELTKLRYMNYPSFCKGAPDFYTEERMERIRNAHKRYEEAERKLRDTIEEIDSLNF